MRSQWSTPWLCLLLQLSACVIAQPVLRSSAAAADVSWPLIAADDFEHGLDRWETTDPGGTDASAVNSSWMLLSLPRHGKNNHVLRVVGPSRYEPPYRSPHSIALLRDVRVRDFELDVELQSTNRKAGGHRDLCLFWGYQDASHFYYVHFGAQSDPHAGQIFIVNNAPRTKITHHETGVPWSDGWHHVRVRHTVQEGRMQVFFDDLSQPLMETIDTTFRDGRIGLGTFDDHGNFDQVTLRGERVE